MRTTAVIGVGLLVLGVLVVVSSGAFDSVTADRGVSVETTDDGDAMLGLEYPSDDRTLELHSAESDGGGGCIIIPTLCNAYEYDNRELVLLEDNSATGDLVLNELTPTVTGDEITGEDEIEHEVTDDGLAVVLGDFSCPSRGLFGPGNQQSRSATVTIAVQVTDGDLAIGLERSIDVECVPD